MSNPNYVTDLEFTQLRYRVALIESRIKILERKSGEETVIAPTPPIATPPIATPPIATPPIATPPIATPPIATPPIATPPIATPPIATPPIATPPIATPPIATPPIATPPIATPPIATPPIATPPIATPPIATPPIATPPIATPPIATPPIATPPIATPPIATPPIATPPIATPPIATPPIATPPIATPPIATPPIATPPIATRSQAPSPSTAPTNNWLNDWENIIGGRLSLWIGALCLFLAVASLLAITWKTLPPPPPIARVIFGFSASLGLLVAGQKLQSLSQRWFSEGLSGTGLAVGYLSAWAGGPYYELWPNEVHLFALAFWAVVGGALAIRNNSRAMLILSAIGGFLTPILLAGHTAAIKSQIPFLFYVLALNAGIVAVSTYKSWRETFYLSYCATIVLILSWSLTVHIFPIRWMVWAFFSLYFALFLAGTLFDSFTKRKSFTDNRIAFVYFHTFLYIAASTLILDLHNGYFMLGMAAFYALMWRISTTLLPNEKRLSHSLATLSLIFSVVFVPLQFEGNLITVGWFAQALGLAITAQRFNSTLLRRGEFIVWCLGITSLFFLCLDKITWTQVWSPKNTYPTDTLALTSLFALGVTSFMLFWAKRYNHKSSISDIYATFIVWGGALFVMREIAIWNLKPLPQIGEYRFYLAAALCVIWSVIAFKVGIKQRLSAIEWNGWGLLALSLATILMQAIGTSQKALPLINAREGAFLMGFGAIAIAYQTLSRGEIREHTADARTLFSLTGFLWLIIGASFEVSGHFAQNYKSAASPLWFVLCAMWAGFGLSGFFASSKLGEDYLKSLSLGVLFAATCVLLWYSVVPTPVWSPLLNPRVITFTLIWLCIYFPLRALYRADEKEGWQAWKIVLNTTLLILPLWLITMEAWNGSRIISTSGDTTTFVLCAIWALFGCAGFYTAQRLGENHLKALSFVILSSAILILLCVSLVSVSTWTPISNIRAGAFAIVWLGVWLFRELIRRNEDLEKSDGWQWCEMTLSSALLLLPLWATTQEIWNGAVAYKSYLGQNYERYASLLISLFWSIYGALTLYCGVIRQDQNLRIAGLGLCALTVCKVYLLDLSFLDGGLRVLSLAGLGGSLLFISWLYGRLAGQENQQENQKRA